MDLAAGPRVCLGALQQASLPSTGAENTLKTEWHRVPATPPDPDLLVRKSSGRVFTRCPPSSVVERVLGKNEVTGSIPVGGSE